MNSRPTVYGFVQIFNELEKGNLRRFLEHFMPLVDELFVYDDGSTDGSYEFLQQYTSHILRGQVNDFCSEMEHKQQLLEYMSYFDPDFILWLDADEVFSANMTERLNELCEQCVVENLNGVAFREINLWRSSSWERLDNLYGVGWYSRLWKCYPGMKFHNAEKEGLHQWCYPYSENSRVLCTNDVSVIHYGFASNESILRKYLSYRNHGMTGYLLERLVDESTLEVRKVPKEIFPEGLWADDKMPIAGGLKQYASS